MKGKKRNVKRILKNKRLIQKRKEAYTNVLASVFTSFFMTMYSTLNVIISKNTFFCQENYFLILSAVVVLILLLKFNKKKNKKVDIKSFDKTLIHGSYAFGMLILIDIISNIL